MKRYGTFNVEIAEHAKGKTPVTTSRGGKLPKRHADSPHIGFVTYRCGAKLSHNFHSITCEVEISLPIALESPVEDVDNFDPEPMERGAALAVTIAEKIFEKEAASLRKTLRAMSKE